MNSIEIGKKFEQEANEWLKSKFENVTWLSKTKWLSPVDFIVEIDGKKVKIDAKAGLSNIRRDNKKIDYYLIKRKGIIKLIKPSEIKEKIINKSYTTIRLKIPKQLNKKLKIEKVELEMKNMEELIIHILSNYYGIKDRKVKQ